MSESPTTFSQVASAALDASPDTRVRLTRGEYRALLSYLPLVDPPFDLFRLYFPHLDEDACRQYHDNVLGAQPLAYRIQCPPLYVSSYRRWLTWAPATRTLCAEPASDALRCSYGNACEEYARTAWGVKYEYTPENVLKFIGASSVVGRSWRVIVMLRRSPEQLGRDYGGGRRPHVVADAIDRIVVDPVEVEEWSEVVPKNVGHSGHCGDCGGPWHETLTSCLYCGRPAASHGVTFPTFLALPVPRAVHEALSAIGVRLEFTPEQLADFHRRDITAQFIRSTAAAMARYGTDLILQLGDPDLQKAVARALLPLVVRDAGDDRADAAPRRRALDYDNDH